MTFCEASTIRDGIHAAYPQGYQVGMTNTARWGWVLKIQRRGGGPHDPTRPLFTSLPVWVCLIGDWPNSAEHLEIDTALVEQMGGTPIGGEAVSPSAELGLAPHNTNHLVQLVGEVSPGKEDAGCSGKCAFADPPRDANPPPAELSGSTSTPRRRPKGEPVCP